MSRWVTALKKSDVSDGKTTSVTVEGKRLCIAYANGQLRAFINECSHMNLPLEESDIVEETIECCYHGSKFDLKTGENIQEPATSPIEVYNVRVMGDEIQIEFKDPQKY